MFDNLIIPVLKYALTLMPNKISGSDSKGRYDIQKLSPNKLSVKVQSLKIKDFVHRVHVDIDDTGICMDSAGSFENGNSFSQTADPAAEILNSVFDYVEEVIENEIKSRILRDLPSKKTAKIISVKTHKIKPHIRKDGTKVKGYTKRAYTRVVLI